MAPHHTKPLPRNYVVHENDVLCGRGSSCFNHTGNRNFRLIIQANINQYVEAKTKHDKSEIIHLVVNFIKSNIYGGAFIKLDLETGCYFEVSDLYAHEKTSQAFRDMLNVNKKSKKNTSMLRGSQDRSAINLEIMTISGTRSDQLMSSICKTSETDRCNSTSSSQTLLNYRRGSSSNEVSEEKTSDSCSQNSTLLPYNNKIIDCLQSQQNKSPTRDLALTGGNVDGGKSLLLDNFSQYLDSDGIKMIDFQRIEFEQDKFDCKTIAFSDSCFHMLPPDESIPSIQIARTSCGLESIHSSGNFEEVPESQKLTVSRSTIPSVISSRYAAQSSSNSLYKQSYHNTQQKENRLPCLPKKIERESTCYGEDLESLEMTSNSLIHETLVTSLDLDSDDSQTYLDKLLTLMYHKAQQYINSVSNEDQIEDLYEPIPLTF